jgi:WD40 repeat protein/serine/threonine protein kinase
MRMEEQEETCSRSPAMPATNREEALFAAALEKPTRAERAAYLAGACGDDEALRARIEALLAAHEASGGVLDAAPSALTPTAAYRPLTEGPGTFIGPYKLLQQIGEGGMGIVYMAEQQEPVRRKVALKVIKPGMDSHQVIARFEAERQALALMDHQNIARVLDANTTESGRPYFVMELVHGVPITQFCDDNKLTPRERLALFVPVCQAIQHAHQKGIIHRDVKPSNVLVTMYDDKPVPKVIDFGVAKAIEQRLTERTMFTQFGALVGTFEYMSPEQAEMNAFGVDTRSDIYSLGVLLYELLTGTTPLERQRLREAALGELVRLIKEEEAPRPSQRLSSSNNLPKIAAARKTEPARLSKLVQGEIDWIVMKCLEKDRARRYDTASGLARDVERYLADEPVDACPPSARYRLSKFARKHRKALVTVAAFVVVLVAGLVMSTLLAVWATTAQREANRQRIASDEAKQEALDAKAEADRQRDEVRVTAYASGIGLAQRAWEENDVVRARELLDEVPREAAGRDLRGFEWDYLDRLCHSEARTLTGAVNSVAFSSDGQRVAAPNSKDHHYTVGIWDSATGKDLVTLIGLRELMATSVAFSPDGRRVAAGNWYGVVKIWDSATGKELLSVILGVGGPSGMSRVAVAFSPDGRRVAAASNDGAVKVWDSATGNELVSFRHPGPGGRNVAFSPDGRRLVTGGREPRIWDSATGKELLTLKGHAAEVGGVAFSPDGRRVASAGDDHTVRIWDSANGKELLSLGHTNCVNCVAFSPDGQRLASGTDDNTVKIWDSATGEELFTLKGHTGWVVGVAFSPDGQRLASVSDDMTVKLWDIGADKERFSFKGHAHRVTSLAFSPDGQRLASGHSDGKVKTWDSATCKELITFKGHTSGWVGNVAFSPDGQRVASWSNDHTVRIWDSATGKELFVLKGYIGCAGFSPDGQRLVAVSYDEMLKIEMLKILDSTTGKELVALKGYTGVASPDGQRLAAVSKDQTLKILDSATGKELVALKGYTTDEVRSVAFSPDGRRLAAGVKIWDSTTGKELVTLKHAGGVSSVAWSPDGQRLATVSLRRVKLWDSATGKELLSLNGGASWVRSLTFSPDGKRLAAGNDEGSIYLWETSISPEVQDRRAARQLVADLFRQKRRRADVLEWLRTVPGMSRSRRQEAVRVAQTYPEGP